MIVWYGLNECVGVFTPYTSCVPCTGALGPHKQLSVTVWNVFENLFLKSTIVADLDCLRNVNVREENTVLRALACRTVHR